MMKESNVLAGPRPDRPPYTGDMFYPLRRVRFALAASEVRYLDVRARSILLAEGSAGTAPTASTLRVQFGANGDEFPMTRGDLVRFGGPVSRLTIRNTSGTTAITGAFYVTEDPDFTWISLDRQQVTV